MALQWQWKQFVLDNYQEAVKSGMAAPWAAEFRAEPDSIVQLVDDKSGRVGLVAFGVVSSVERSGELRFKYRVFWVRSHGETFSVEAGGRGEAQVYPG